jgi:LPXTG-site transpeptidase (sortase) family protein
MQAATTQHTTPDAPHLASGGQSLTAGPDTALTGGRSLRRVSRRGFLALALSGIVAVACQPKEQIVYVSPPTPTASPRTDAPAAPQPEPTPPPAPTQQAAQNGAAKPGAQTGASARQGPIQLPIPMVSGPAAALAAQSQVIPVTAPRTHAYTNRLQVPDHLQIPSIGVDTKVVPIGTKTDAQGHILWETAAFAVGHHKGTGLPGEAGNVVLSGHISSPREGAVFSKLPQVKAGDGIVVGTAERQFLYVVVDTKVVTPDAVEVLDPTDKAMVTMITCVPDGVYSHRLVVKAEAV